MKSYIANESAVDAAAECIRGGGVVLVPTDTVYGLAISPDSAEAVERLFRMKGRPGSRNIPVMVPGRRMLESLGVEIGDAASRLVDAYWPGALTIAFGFEQRRPRPAWLRDRYEVGVRQPENGFLLELMRVVGPLLVTSANAHGEPPNTEPFGAIESLIELPDVVVDGGNLASSPSTLVNVRVSPIRIERVGAIAPEAIQQAVGAETRVEVVA